jgi:hypothetical protein
MRNGRRDDYHEQEKDEMRLLFDKFLHLKILTGPVSRFQDVIAHLSAFQIPSFLPCFP